MTTNSINIFFGRVVSTDDPLFLKRLKIKINGVTDLLESDDDLPFYFPFSPLSYLPMVDDICIVLIINNRVEHGFYSGPIYNNNSEELSSDNRPSTGGIENKNDIGIGDDYEHYLEILYRKIDNKQVKMTYSPSEGIIFENSEETGIHIELEKLRIFRKTIEITLDDKEIKIGNTDKDYEATFNSETTLKVIEAMFAHDKNIYTLCLNMGKIIQTAAAASPFTSAIGAALASFLPVQQVPIEQENAKIKSDANSKLTISETVKISK